MAVNEIDLRPLVLERKSTPQLIPAVIMLIPGPEKLLSSRLVTQLKVTVGCRPCLKRLRIISSRTFLSVTVLGKDRLVNLQQDGPRGGPDRYSGIQPTLPGLQTASGTLIACHDCHALPSLFLI